MKRFLLILMLLFLTACGQSTVIIDWGAVWTVIGYIAVGIIGMIIGGILLMFMIFGEK